MEPKFFKTESCALKYILDEMKEFIEDNNGCWSDEDNNECWGGEAKQDYDKIINIQKIDKTMLEEYRNKYLEGEYVDYKLDWRLYSIVLPS